MPSVQDTASMVPLVSKDTCLTGLDCSRKCMTFSMSCVLTTLTSNSSLATAIHSPSFDSVMSRTGSEQRVSICSIELEISEYFVTVPSSAPTTKNSFVATTAVWFSVRTSIIAGSSSEPCLKMRIALFVPTVINLRPLGVYARYAGPGASAKKLVSRPNLRSHVVGEHTSRSSS